MKFLEPFWLWMIIPCLLTTLILVLDEKKKLKKFQIFAQPETWKSILLHFRKNARIHRTIVWSLGVILLFLSLARPQFGTREEIVKSSGLDIIVVLDVSQSMMVQDVFPNRLEKSKHLIQSFVKQLNGDRMGIVIFAGNAQLNCPLTTDLSYLLDTVDVVTTQSVAVQGTDVAAGLDAALKAIERGTEDERTLSPNDTPANVVILISDGEDHEKRAESIVLKMKEKGVKFYTIGVGTEKGGPIPVFDQHGNSVGFKRDSSGKTVVSQFNSQSLNQLTSIAEGKFWNASLKENEVQEILHDLGALNRSDYAERKYTFFEERYQIPLFISLLLFLFEIWIPLSSYSSHKMKMNKHLSVFIFLTMSISFLSSFRLAFADPLDVYLQNKKGIEALEAGNAEEAQKKFSEAQALNPHLPELNFNQGVTQFQKGDVDRSIHLFEKSILDNQKLNHPGLAGKSYYNLGVAQEKKGDIPKAIQSYLHAIEEAKKNNDPYLEQAVRKNLELLLKKKKEEQKKNSQDQSKDSKDKSKENSEEKEKNKDSEKNSDNKQPDQQKNKENQKDSKKSDHSDKKDKSESPEDSKSSQSNQSNDEKDKKNNSSSASQKKQNFDSKKMTPDDAERVMSELKNREKELQQKLQNDQRKAQPQLKDW